MHSTFSEIHHKDNDVVIVGAVRTPMCRSRKGALKDVTPSTLLQTALEGLLSRTANSSSSFSSSEIDEVCIGNVLCPANGYASFRMACVMAGIPTSASMKTVNRQCSSGLEAIAQIANAVATNQISIGIGAGVESMTTYPMSSMEPPPFDYDGAETHANSTTIMDCLTPMGITSENVAKDYQGGSIRLDRTYLDEFSTLSHRKAAAAQASGFFRDEIVPVGNVQRDDGIRPKTTPEILSKLRPIFDKEGVTTAGNASQTTDGASAVLLMKRSEAVKRQLPIMGVWRGYVVKGVPPRVMGIGPAVAIPEVLHKAGLTIKDIDVFEINEAFATQAIYCIEHLKIPKHKVNPNGGAIALGHPLGCTGARMVTSILHEMHRGKLKYGVISMCIGTGMGAAAVVEVEPQAQTLTQTRSSL